MLFIDVSLARTCARQPHARRARGATFVLDPQGAREQQALLPPEYLDSLILSRVGPTPALQPRRATISLGAVGCKRFLGAGFFEKWLTLRSLSPLLMRTNYCFPAVSSMGLHPILLSNLSRNPSGSITKNWRTPIISLLTRYHLSSMGNLIG
jgi:hypothetical protein